MATNTIDTMKDPVRRVVARVLITLCGVALLFSLGVESHADSPDWVLDAIKLATDDPGEVQYVHGVHRDCPFGADDVERVIKQVLIANDVRPRDLSTSRELFEQLALDVTVSCIASDDLGFVYVVDAYFALHSPLDGKRLFIGRRFGRFGSGDRASIRHAVEASVAAAADAFRSANRAP